MLYARIKRHFSDRDAYNRRRSHRRLELGEIMVNRIFKLAAAPRSEQNGFFFNLRQAPSTLLNITVAEKQQSTL